MHVPLGRLWSYGTFLMDYRGESARAWWHHTAQHRHASSTMIHNIRLSQCTFAVRLEACDVVFLLLAGDEEGAEKIWARAVRVDPTIASM
eukprot:1507571-Rhodomonas_salina.2